jgi:hypothetical protein
LVVIFSSASCFQTPWIYLEKFWFDAFQMTAE